MSCVEQVGHPDIGADDCFLLGQYGRAVSVQVYPCLLEVEPRDDTEKILFLGVLIP